MNVSAKLVLPAIPVLNKIAHSTKLRSVVAYRMSRLLKKLEPELQSLNDARGELVKKYGKEGAESEAGTWTVDPEKMAEFKKELEELYDTEIEVWATEFVPTDFDGAELSPAEFSAIDFIIKE